MADCFPVARRLLLAQVGSGVFGTFLLPGALQRAMAQGATAQRTPHSVSTRHPTGHPTSGQLPLVMLDPGHGGKDPGAIGVSGTYEKHISLTTALELQHQLVASGHYRVALTRARDVFIPLEDRVAHAQEHGASLFVSMHADALNDHTVRGASVYTLANTASDAQTAALAQRENSADRFLGRSWHGVSPQVARILASLVRQETTRGSGRLAHDLVDSLDQDLPMLPNPDRHAGFVVLKAADIPSVLVEMGFMSNPSDEALLRQAKHRVLVARAMKRAVDAYFTGTSHLIATG
jgi:N-acetylmuramoyl-L-alanine amidase